MEIQATGSNAEIVLAGAVNVNGELFVRLESRTNIGSESVLVRYNDLNTQQQSFVNGKWLDKIADFQEQNNRAMGRNLDVIENLVGDNTSIILENKTTLERLDALSKSMDPCLSKMDAHIAADKAFIEKNAARITDAIETANKNAQDVPPPLVMPKSFFEQFVSCIKAMFSYVASFF